MTKKNGDNSASPHPLSADKPRATPADDLFGYAPFAKLLAESVLRGSPSDGIVVGIYGAWGLGKSSVLNFIEHSLKNDGGDLAPIVVRFNPWWFSGREDLLRRFFVEFERAVAAYLTGPGAGRRKVDRAFEKIRSNIKMFGDAMSLSPDPMLKAAGGIVAIAARPAPIKDVVAIKKELADQLGQVPLRVIVLVDDVDRLLPEEMVEVLRMVRSVADFPNVHYVLAFDRDVVARGIAGVGNEEEGRRYLEKIIQVPFDLPRPDHALLEELFLTNLAKIVGDTAESHFAIDRWADMFRNGISPFLRTPREVTRLLNAIAVPYPILRDEVNSIDFAAIETLRLFAPIAYDTIRQNRERFIGVRLAVQQAPEEEKAFHVEWLRKMDSREGQVRALVIRLFPAVGGVLAGNRGKLASAEEIGRRSISSEASFATYFKYDFPRHLSRAAFLDIARQSSTALRAQLRAFADERLENGKTKARWFLETLQQEIHAGAPVPRTGLEGDILNAAETIIQRASPPLPFDIPDDLVIVFALETLLKCRPAAERLPELLPGLHDAGLSTTLRIAVTLASDHGRFGATTLPEEERTLPSTADIDQVEAYARQRLDLALRDASIWQAPGFIRMLADWKLLSGAAVVKEALSKWTAAAANLGFLLSESAGKTSRGRIVVNLETLEGFVGIDEIFRRRAELDEVVKEAPVAKEALRNFLDQYQQIEPRRRAARERAELAISVVREIESSGWFPLESTIKARIESKLAVFEETKRIGLIVSVLNGRLMVPIQALRGLPDPVAKQELQRCVYVLSRLKQHYRNKPEASLLVTAGELASMADGWMTPQQLSRSLILLRAVTNRDGTTVMHLNQDSEGTPIDLRLSDGILVPTEADLAPIE